jgi:tetratricopeptide (TPR) repeat protein
LIRPTLSRLLPAAIACALALPASVCAHGGFDERIAELTADLAQRPGDPALLFELADVQARHGDFEAALAGLQKVEQLAPGQFTTDLVRGAALLAGAQPAAARQALDRFLAAHPKHVRALVLRAHAAQELGDQRASLADLRTALQANATPEPDLVRETADTLLAAGRAEEAMQVLDSGIKHLGPVPSLVLQAMTLEIIAGRFDAALTRVDAMQRSAPRPEPWMAKRAGLLAQAGRRQEARAAWTALAAHLAALPNLERGSHAMSLLAEQAQQALRSLSSAAPPSTSR